jgi:hypothetical protein
VADEREIHSKLQQILHILNQQKEDKEEGEQEEQIQPHTDRMVRDVFDEASTEELQLYVFQANEIGGPDQQQEDIVDLEYEKFFEDAGVDIQAKDDSEEEEKE